MTIVFKFPSLKEVKYCYEVYDKIFNKCIENKIATKEDLSFYLKKYKLFTVEMEQELEKIEALPDYRYPSFGIFKDKIEETKEIEKYISEIILGEKEIDIKKLFIRKEEPKIIQQYRELSNIKNNYLRHSAECIAEAIKLNYLTYFCTYRNSINKFWNSYKEFQDDKRKILIKGIQIKLAEFLSGFNQTIFRKIARNPLWRTRWIGATKTGAPLFKGNICEWDINKVFLVYWSNFYDSIYSAYEPPEQHVIEDDQLLDNWLEQKSKEFKNKKTDTTINKDGVQAIFKQNIKSVKKR